MVRAVICEVEIVCLCPKLTGERIDLEHRRRNGEFFPLRANCNFLCSSERSNPSVRETVLFRLKKFFFCESAFFQLFFNADNVCYAVEEPRINSCHVVDRLRRYVSADRLRDCEEPMRSGDLESSGDWDS